MAPILKTAAMGVVKNLSDDDIFAFIVPRLKKLPKPIRERLMWYAWRELAHVRLFHEGRWDK